MLLNRSIEKLIQHIQYRTKIGNIDNISRTNYYEKYYFLHPEIKWAFLATVVSRNAGWNICDLKGNWIPQLINRKECDQLFHTYERANWLIFQDAFPQLLLYHYSTKWQRPLFHLLRYFQVSSFMEHEWQYFWEQRDHYRLLYALIINEQNVIQQPVIENHYYKKHVFSSLAFKIQDLFHFSVVLMPSCDGSLYGASVTNFRKLTSRIELGKRLSNILFQNNVYQHVLTFIKSTPHTGSRHDYQQYMPQNSFAKTPFLRTHFPIINHSPVLDNKWDKRIKIRKSWYEKPKLTDDINITDWYLRKQKEIEVYLAFKQWLKLKSSKY
ncbi:DUF2515 family protein [Bacillus kwashiorkori]|uniref:DUF2515 family protein n=1 Tax=Bacillus kwashiorkori TaxID=1522318 RepID=UPI000784FC30|nr:DUF2515 family protein [Bacillus kwashiorkori]